MHEFGLITGRHPEDAYHPMTDVIHKVLNDITVDDWSIIIGGDSHTRMSKGVAFGADSGTVALALATGQATMPIPETVKVTFIGEMGKHMENSAENYTIIWRTILRKISQTLRRKF